MFRFVFMVGAGLLLAACGGGGGGGGDSSNASDPSRTGDATVLAANDLGMHCMDREFSVFSILPPFNVVNAQVVRRNAEGRPFLEDTGGVEVFYEGRADANGSINTSSAGADKTDFWQYAGALFGATLQDGEGLTGLFMPEDNPQNPGPQAMAFESGPEWFAARGIPITPIDDSLNDNPYPLLRISARDARGGSTLGHLDVVVPVAMETDCRNCHNTGGIAADDPGITWSDHTNIEVQTKRNILLLHDDQHPGLNLHESQPVLCAQCHYSAALDLAGAGPAGNQVGNPNFSHAMHNYHGQLQENGSPLFDPNGTVEETCYQCHPGNVTQCQRGAMRTGGMDCGACHGDMLAVGGESPLLPDGSLDGSNDGQPRRPWTDLPRCQSCHTGDAVSHLSGANLVPDASGIRLRQAFRTGDASASPLLAVNRRFAEAPDGLYRNSHGHGGIACEMCHGSTHAEWPIADGTANDNVAARTLQGHTGPIIECTVCHREGSLPLTTEGPHGLHNINDARWVDEIHGEIFERDEEACRACHGLTLQGTILSRAAADRRFEVEDAAVSLSRGTAVACDTCHELPD